MTVSVQLGRTCWCLRWRNCRIAPSPLESTMKQRNIAQTQSRLGAPDLEAILALARGRTLARAGERLGVDASTVFRSLKRVERKLGQRLFERGRGGYLPTELATQLAGHAEEMEAALESARSSIEKAPTQVSGAVRISTTDVLLHGLIAPALARLR